MVESNQMGLSTLLCCRKRGGSATESWRIVSQIWRFSGRQIPKGDLVFWSALEARGEEGKEVEAVGRQVRAASGLRRLRPSR